ncbi:hypothetical protein H8E77_23115 [bacterium]|nr:hypothetical protein [bacterium]
MENQFNEVEGKVTETESLADIMKQINSLSQRLSQFSDTVKTINDKFEAFDDKITRMDNQFANRIRGLSYVLKEMLHAWKKASDEEFVISPEVIDAALQGNELTIPEHPEDSIDQKFDYISQELSKFFERSPEELDVFSAQLLVEFDLMLYDKSAKYIELDSSDREKEGKELLEDLLDEYRRNIEAHEKNKGVNTILTDLENKVIRWQNLLTGSKSTKG